MITRHAEHAETFNTGPVKAEQAKQGDRRHVTLWILLVGTVLAGIGGWVLLSNVEDYTGGAAEPAGTPSEATQPLANDAS